MSASGNDIEKYWPLLFANALKGQNVSALLTNLSGSAPSSVAATSAAPAEAETKKEEKKEEKEDAEDALEGGLGFDEEW